MVVSNQIEGTLHITELIQWKIADLCKQEFQITGLGCGLDMTKTMTHPMQ